MCLYMLFFVSLTRKIKRGFRSNFLNLINSVSTSIREIMSVKKPPPPSCLFLLYEQYAFSFVLLLFFIGTYINVKFSGSTTRKPRGLFFLITILSSNDLFNISIHKRCSPSNTSFTSSLLNLDVKKPLELSSKKTRISVSILLKLAGSILICLGEQITKTLFLCALDF